MSNKDIRLAVIEAGLKYYTVAKAYGCTDANFSRKLREELPEEEKTKLLDIIENLMGEKQK
jgi:hypothetical protein